MTRRPAPALQPCQWSSWRGVFGAAEWNPGCWPVQGLWAGCRHDTTPSAACSSFCASRQHSLAFPRVTVAPSAQLSLQLTNNLIPSADRKWSSSWLYGILCTRSLPHDHSWHRTAVKMNSKVTTSERTTTGRSLKWNTGAVTRRNAGPLPRGWAAPSAPAAS